MSLTLLVRYFLTIMLNCICDFEDFIPRKAGKGRGYSEKYKLDRTVPEAQNLMLT